MHKDNPCCAEDREKMVDVQTWKGVWVKIFNEGSCRMMLGIHVSSNSI